MSLFRRAIEARSGSAFAAGSDRIPTNGESAIWQGGYSSSSEQAMRHAAVYACVRIVADTIASFPVDAYTGDVGMHLGQADRVTPKPGILTKPSDYLSGVQWLHQVMMSLLLQGNAYGLISATDRLGYPTQIDLLDPQQVTVEKAKGSDVNTATGRKIPSGVKVFKSRGSTLTSEQVWHCPGPMMPGELAGLSPVKYASRVIGMGVEAERFGLDFFANGMHQTAVASTDQPVSEEQALTIKERLRRATANRETPVLGLGIKLTPWSVTPEDSMLLEVQRYNQVMVCQLFGVAPEMIGAASQGSSITYANREQRAMDFLNTAINPWLVRLEDSFGGLFPRTTFVKFDTKSLLKSDLLTRYQAWKLGTDGGWLDPSTDVRQFEDLPDLKEPLVPPSAPAGVAPTEGFPA